MEIKKYTSANREAWNEVTPIHQQARKENLEELFQQKGYSTLDDCITQILKGIGLKGKHVAQLSCNNGREVLSLVNLGASSGTGFDISDAAIDEAKKLARISGLNCNFVRTDVYDIGNEYKAAFDLVYISIGALAWLPDLNKFFQIAAGMLKPQGHLVIYEMHPFLDMLATEDEPEFTDPLKITHSYFNKEPWVGNSGIDYVGKSSYQGKTNYCFPHCLSEILNAVIKSGIAIKEFNEYPHDISSLCAHLEKEQKAPLCYVLIGKKEEE